MNLTPPCAAHVAALNELAHPSSLLRTGVTWFAALILVATLAACGSDSTPVAADTATGGESSDAGNDDTMDDGDDHGDEHDDDHGDEHGDEHDDEHGDDHEGEEGEFHIETLGRLAVQESGAASVRIVELDNNSVIATLATTNPVTALAASPDRRYALAVQRNDDLVQFVDGGLWQEDHVSHLHDYRADPMLTPFSLNGVRPTHVEVHGELLAVFNDGLADTDTAASVTVLSDGRCTALQNHRPAICWLAGGTQTTWTRCPFRLTCTGMPTVPTGS
jgi:predicted small lipoprotein YifL